MLVLIKCLLFELTVLCWFRFEPAYGERVGALNNRRTKILFIFAIAELTHKLVCKVFAIHMPEYWWPHNSFIFSHIQNGKKHIQTLSSIDFELAYACGYMWINMIKDSYTQHTASLCNSLGYFHLHAMFAQIRFISDVFKIFCLVNWYLLCIRCTNTIIISFA